MHPENSIKRKKKKKNFKGSAFLIKFKENQKKEINLFDTKKAIYLKPRANVIFSNKTQEVLQYK